MAVRPGQSWGKRVERSEEKGGKRGERSEEKGRKGTNEVSGGWLGGGGPARPLVVAWVVTGWVCSSTALILRAR